MKKLNKKFDNENGSALVIVMMVLVVVSALGGALGMVTINSHNLAEHTQDTNSAYYIAEAGANMAYEEFKTEVISAYGVSSTENDFFTADSGVKKAQASVNGKVYSEEVFQKTGGIQPTASIEVGNPVGIGDQRTFTIKSTGTIDGKTRVVEKPIEIEWVSKSAVPIDLSAALTLNGIARTNNNTTINGNTKLTKNAIFQNKNNFNFNGEETWFTETELQYDQYGSGLYNWVNPIVQKRIDEVDFTNTDNKSMIYSDDVDLNGSLISNGGDLQFHKKATITGDVITNGGDIIFDHSVVITGNVITRGGRIMFNGNSSAVIDGDVITTNGEIVFNGNTTVGGSVITLGNQSSIRGNNNKTKIRGNIIANGGEIMFGNHPEVGGAILNPKNKVTANQGGTFNGPIVINSFSSDNNVIITHTAGYLEYFPFNIPGIGGGTGGGNIEDIISTKPATEN